MKIYKVLALLIFICTFISLSCLKNNDSYTNQTGSGSVVFWTKNTANLMACSNDIVVNIAVPVFNGSVPYDSAHITGIDFSEPSSCGIRPSATVNLNAQKYTSFIKNCTTGVTTSINFTVVANTCLKIEIP